MDDFQQKIMQKAQDIKSAAIKRAYANHEVWPYSGPPRLPMSPYQNSFPELYYADIPNLFQPYSLLPNPAIYGSVVDKLNQAMGFLRLKGLHDPIDPNNQLSLAREELHQLVLAGNVLSSWNDEAANAFKNNFLNTSAVKIESQFLLIAVLKSSIEAHKAMYETARTDIVGIADKHFDALQNYGLSCDQNTWNVVFSVVGSVVAIASVPTTGGGSAIALPAIGAAVSTGGSALAVASLVSPDPKEERYSGDTAAQIINAMRSAMEGLDQRINHIRDKISETLTNTAVSVAGNEIFKFPRPSLN